RTERCRDAGDGVGATRYGCCDHAAKLAGLTRVAVSCVCGHLLMTHVNDSDPLIDATVIDVDDVTAAKCEDRIHTFVLQSPGDEVATRDDSGVTALLLQSVLGRGRFRLNRQGIYGCHISSNQNYSRSKLALTSGDPAVRWCDGRRRRARRPRRPGAALLPAK